jgi:hypothetical protein
MASDVRIALGGELLDGGMKGIIHSESLAERSPLRELRGVTKPTLVLLNMLPPPLT